VTVEAGGGGGEYDDIAVSLPPGQERVPQGEGGAEAVQEQRIRRFAQRIDGKGEIKLAGEVGPGGWIGQSGQVWPWWGGALGGRGQDLREGDVAEGRIGCGEEGYLRIGKALARGQNGRGGNGTIRCRKAAHQGLRAGGHAEGGKAGQAGARAAR
jgi:hypothetical protein